MNLLVRINHHAILLLLMAVAGLSLSGCQRSNNEHDSLPAADSSSSLSRLSDDPDFISTKEQPSSAPEGGIDQNENPVVPSNLMIELVPDGYKRDGGPLRVALYDGPETFNKIELATWKDFFASDGSPIQIEIEANRLNSNVIAIAIYQDSNSNEKLDKNAFGIPQELYGFSNNPKRGFGPPKFAEVAVQVQSTRLSLAIKLQ